MINKKSIPIHQKINDDVTLDSNNVGELLFNKIKKNPSKKFLICPGKDIEDFSYYEFGIIVKKAMNFLADKKLQKNDSISIVFHNSSEFLVLYFAGLILGLTIIPINPDLAPREIQYIIKDSKSRLVFFAKSLKEKMDEVKKECNNVEFTEISSLQDFNSDRQEIEYSFSQVNLEDTAVIIYTSGTTGNPKGVMLSHLNLIADAFAISQRFEFNEKTRTLCILPLFHNNGQITTLLAPLYAGGSTVIVKGKVSITSFWDLIDEYQANWTSVMSSILSILLSLTKERKDNCLIGILCGGQILTKSVQEKFENRFNVPIYEGYGLTETTSFSCINGFPKHKRRNNSIGKPLSTNEMCIFDENSIEVKDESEGEICIRGHNVMIGYLGLEERNREAFKSGWFHSGDYGRKDKDGYYYFHGRQDSLIIKGGENIYPAELENILYQHSDVDECAVIGIPDKLLGENICAFVKIKTTKNITEKSLLEFCKNKISNFKQPKKIIIINELPDLHDIPKGPTKKILYRKLKDYYIKNIKN